MLVKAGILVGDGAEARAGGDEAREQFELLVEEHAVVVVAEAIALDRAAREVDLEAAREREALQLVEQGRAAPPAEPLVREQVARVERRRRARLLHHAAEQIVGVQRADAEARA